MNRTPPSATNSPRPGSPTGAARPSAKGWPALPCTRSRAHRDRTGNGSRSVSTPGRPTVGGHARFPPRNRSSHRARRPTTSHLSISAVRADALFASALQPSAALDPDALGTHSGHRHLRRITATTGARREDPPVPGALLLPCRVSHADATRIRRRCRRRPALQSGSGFPGWTRRYPRVSCRTNGDLLFSASHAPPSGQQGLGGPVSGGETRDGVSLTTLPSRSSMAPKRPSGTWWTTWTRFAASSSGAAGPAAVSDPGAAGAAAIHAEHVRGTPRRGCARCRSGRSPRAARSPMRCVTTVARCWARQSAGRGVPPDAGHGR